MVRHAGFGSDWRGPVMGGRRGSRNVAAQIPDHRHRSVQARVFRAVFRLGNVWALNFFNKKKNRQDPRRGFINWSLMTFGAWDYPADARGYTWGAALEYITPDWAVRAGRFEQPKDSNGLPLNSRIMSSYGDVVEFERGYEIGGQTGRIRLLAFRNQAVMGKFSDAVSQSSANGGGPRPPNLPATDAKTGGG